MVQSNIPSSNDSLEMLLTKNITHVLEGFDGEVAFASLSKVMQVLMIGLANDKEQAFTFVDKLSEHLRHEIEQKNNGDFGFIKNDNSNGPIAPKHDGGFIKKE